MRKNAKGGAIVNSFSMQKTPKGYTFDLRSGNGQIIAVSESYRTEAACRNGIRSVYANADAPLEDCTADEKQVPNPKFQLYQDKRGLFRFRLKARNGRIIAVSQAYRSKAACLEGIESVRANAKILIQEDSV